MTQKVIIPLVLMFSVSHAATNQISLIKSDPNPEVNRLLKSVFDQGIPDYLGKTLSNRLYVEEIFPNNLFHFFELVQHGHETSKPKMYYKSVIRLVTDQLIKTAPYINAGAFEETLRNVKPYLQPHFIVDASKSFNSLQPIINEMLLSTFVSNFSGFKANPGTFLETVSQDIEDAVDLRKLMMLFLESSMSKLIWNPQDKEKTWENVKKIADQLQSYYKHSIIADTDDLNSLYITLLERYCFFLGVTEKQLPSPFWQAIKDDITGNKIALFELPEQEQYLRTKKDRILGVVYSGHAKACARERDILI